MSRKYMNYVGQVITDANYHALGNPKDFMEVHMDVELPFRIYCRTREDDWEEVEEETRVSLIQKLKDTKMTYSKSDYRYYMIDFQLASLGGL